MRIKVLLLSLRASERYAIIRRDIYEYDRENADSFNYISTYSRIYSYLSNYIQFAS